MGNDCLTNSKFNGYIFFRRLKNRHLLHKFMNSSSDFAKNLQENLKISPTLLKNIHQNLSSGKILNKS